MPLLCRVLWSLMFSLVQHRETSYSTRNTLSGRKQLALIHIWPMVNLPQLFQMVSRQMVLEPEAWLPEREWERGSLGLGTARATSTYVPGGSPCWLGAARPKSACHWVQRHPSRLLSLLWLCTYLGFCPPGLTDCKGGGNGDFLSCTAVMEQIAEWLKTQ